VGVGQVHRLEGDAVDGHALKPAAHAMHAPQ
jgi:hypothetical protein